MLGCSPLRSCLDLGFLLPFLLTLRGQEYLQFPGLQFPGLEQAAKVTWNILVPSLDVAVSLIMVHLLLWAFNTSVSTS